MDTVFSVPSLPRLAECADEEWVAAARRGESWAVEQFYYRYQSLVHALCYRLLGRAEDAEDATQATFMRAIRELPRFRGQSSVKTWVYRIAVNVSVSQLRKRRDRTEPEVRGDEGGGMPDGAPAVVERLVVRAALSRLSAHHQTILVLQFWEGLSVPEMAAVLGISHSAVKMRLHRARDEFRRWYPGDLEGGV